MVEAVDESMIRNFVHRLFRKTDNIGTLTVKSIRSKFLKHLGKDKLEAEHKELFKKSVHDIYAQYANKHQQENGDQEDGDSQTATQSDGDNTASSSSVSPRKKKRRVDSSDNDSDKETTFKKQRKQKNGMRKQSSKELKGNIESRNDHSDEDEKDVKNVSNTQTSQQTEADNASIDEQQQKEEKSPKNKTAREIKQKKRSIEYTSEEEQEQTETKRQKIVEEERPDDSSSNESLNSEEKQVSNRKTKSKHKDNCLREGGSHAQKKNGKKKSQDTSPSSGARKKKLSPPSEDSAKLRNLKRYARSCGMHLKYVDIFADCKSMSQKERILDNLIRERTGFEGRITLKMCQKYKKEKEEADEVAELDCRNILITTDSRQRTTRSTRVGSDNKPAPPTVSNLDAPSNAFSRLKGIVDSDGSESEDDKIPAKQTLITATDKEESYDNRKKRRRLDSSSEDDHD